MKRIRVSAIVPAAGKGTRIRRFVKEDLPKPYLPLGGVSILGRTLLGLNEVPEIDEIVVACEPAYRRRVREMARQHGVTKLRKVVAGGKTRAESVGKALRSVSNRSRAVLVHDAVRPFLSSRTIRRLVRHFSRNGKQGWIAARPVTPTVKEIRRGDIVRTVDRSVLWEAETPQIFPKEMLVRAYRHFHRHPFPATDDAALVEKLGEQVKVFPLTENNMKITTPLDLETARRLVERRETRTGWGEDRHRLRSGLPLYIGGVRVPSPRGALGHSDGDALLHAVIDALLGAAGLGDIGDFFPDTDPRYRGIRSAKMLSEVLALVAGRRFTVANVDATVMLERPKLGPLKQKIRKNVAGLLGIAEDAVGVKAKTAEGLGAEGRGERITARAVVTLERMV
jgi:2-C-methyl-D-erythritol 4-phosphate cytidylyltransferase/2-C-methyl-D-erythritol 2,4-cyclodiphosphate synthase